MLSDAKAAFVRVADAYETLRHPASQWQALVALGKPSHAKPHKSGAAAAAATAASSRPRKPRSFMDVLREWEEFEWEFFDEEESQREERQHRAEKKVRRPRKEKWGGMTCSACGAEDSQAFLRAD